MAEGKTANWQRARILYPASDYSEGEWLALYESMPDLLTQMLGDLYRVYKSEEEKRLGTSNPQGGRRKSYINGNLDELWRVITPEYSIEPLSVSLRALSEKHGQRNLARKAHISQGNFSQMIHGGRPATRQKLEAIARAADIHPAYFLEWRTMVIQDLVARVFAMKPNVSIAVIKSLGQP